MLGAKARELSQRLRRHRLIGTARRFFALVCSASLHPRASRSGHYWRFQRRWPRRPRGVTERGEIFHTTDLRTWSYIPGRLAQIASGNLNDDGRDDLVGVTSDGFIFYTTNLRNWTYIPGRLAQITAGDLNNDGFDDLVGTTGEGYIFYTTNLRNWIYVPGRLAQVASGNLGGSGEDDLVGVTKIGDIFFNIGVAPLSGGRRCRPIHRGQPKADVLRKIVDANNSILRGENRT